MKLIIVIIILMQLNPFLVAGYGLFKLLCWVSCPIMVVKTLISLIHCYVASINLSIIDVNERHEKQ